MRVRHLVVDGFFAEARAMRRVLDRRLGDALTPFDPARFAWEHWHVHAQFSQLRTPARAFFPKELVDAFEARLLAWAGARLGVSRLGGPPWLSAITDGGFQGLHRDSPNGHFAFSYGLGREARFRGGETLLARDELLDYWRTGGHRDESADAPLFDEVPSRFDRVVVFDSRIPHAVRGVEGPRRARDGRIAIQGWLEVAGCVADDAELAREASRAADLLARGARRELAGAEGVLTARVELDRDGRAREVKPLASTLVDAARDGRARDQPDRAARALVRALSRLRVPRAAKGRARVIVPIVVREGGRASVTR